VLWQLYEYIRMLILVWWCYVFHNTAMNHDFLVVTYMNKQKRILHRSPSQGHLLRNRHVYYRVHKSTQLIPIMGHMNSVHISIVTSNPHIRVSSGLFPSCFPPKIMMNFTPLTCVLHSPLTLIYLHVTILIIVYFEGYKLWRFLLCNFLQSAVTFSVLGPNILLSILFSNALKSVFLLYGRETMFHANTKQ
jgi:hypothetical protein